MSSCSGCFSSTISGAAGCTIGGGGVIASITGTGSGTGGGGSSSCFFAAGFFSSSILPSTLIPSSFGFSRSTFSAFDSSLAFKSFEPRFLIIILSSSSTRFLTVSFSRSVPTFSTCFVPMVRPEASSFSEADDANSFESMAYCSPVSLALGLLSTVNPFLDKNSRMVLCPTLSFLDACPNRIIFSSAMLKYPYDFLISLFENKLFIQIPSSKLLKHFQLFPLRGPFSEQAPLYLGSEHSLQYPVRCA